MTPYQLVELTMEAQARLDTSWALFLSIHAALFGGIVYVDRPLRYVEKIVVIISYSAIAYYNYYLTRSSQKLLQSFYQDIASIKEKQKLDLEVINYLEQFVTSSWWWGSYLAAVIVHLTALVIVILAVINDKSLQEKISKKNE